MTRAWICALGLAAATAALYAPVLGYDFVRFDDPRYVSENPYIADGLTLDTLVWSLTAVRKSNWHPVTWWSHALDLELYGLDPGGHHLTSVLLHVANALLLFVVLRTATGAVWRSVVVSALFALHPLHVESVAWISERKDVLSACFGLASTWMYVRYAQRGGGRLLDGAAALLFVGLLAKPMLVTLPFVFLLLDYWPLARLRVGRSADGGSSLRALVREKWVLFLVGGTVLVNAFVAQRIGGGARASELIPASARAANAVVSYVRYLGMLVWPQDLSVHYPHPYLEAVGGVPYAAWQVALAALALAAITAAVLRLRARRYLVVGWLWYVGMLVPVIGFFQIGTQAIADRYTYLPAIGIFVAVTWGTGDLAEAAARRLPAVRPVVAAATVAVLAAYAAASALHLPTWRDSLSLFEQAHRVSPRDTIVLNNLGNELVARGRYAEAVPLYRRALEIAPGYRKARENLDRALAASETDAARD